MTGVRMMPSTRPSPCGHALAAAKDMTDGEVQDAQIDAPCHRLSGPCGFADCRLRARSHTNARESASDAYETGHDPCCDREA